MITLKMKNKESNFWETFADLFPILIMAAAIIIIFILRKIYMGY
jgi:hypothetical protein